MNATQQLFFFHHITLVSNLNNYFKNQYPLSLNLMFGCSNYPLQMQLQNFERVMDLWERTVSSIYH